MLILSISISLYFVMLCFRLPVFSPLLSHLICKLSTTNRLRNSTSIRPWHSCTAKIWREKLFFAVASLYWSQQYSDSLFLLLLSMSCSSNIHLELEHLNHKYLLLILLGQVIVWNYRKTNTRRLCTGKKGGHKSKNISWTLGTMEILLSYADIRTHQMETRPNIKALRGLGLRTWWLGRV